MFAHKLAFRRQDLDSSIPRVDNHKPAFRIEGGVFGRQELTGAEIQHVANPRKEADTNDLEATNDQLERFTYTVSHDLKAPLITIRGFVGLLKQDLANGDKTQADEDMERFGELPAQNDAWVLLFERRNRIAAPAG